MKMMKKMWLNWATDGDHVPIVRLPGYHEYNVRGGVDIKVDNLALLEKSLEQSHST